MTDESGSKVRPAAPPEEVLVRGVAQVGAALVAGWLVRKGLDSETAGAAGSVAGQYAGEIAVGVIGSVALALRWLGSKARDRAWAKGSPSSGVLGRF